MNQRLVFLEQRAGKLSMGNFVELLVQKGAGLTFYETKAGIVLALNSEVSWS